MLVCFRAPISGVTRPKKPGHCPDIYAALPLALRPTRANWHQSVQIHTTWCTQSLFKGGNHHKRVWWNETNHKLYILPPPYIKGIKTQVHSEQLGQAKLIHSLSSSAHMHIQEQSKIFIIHYSSFNNHFPDSVYVWAVFTAKITEWETNGISLRIIQNYQQAFRSLRKCALQ